jgi:serine/threonine-protein kinase RsbW
MGSEMSSHVLSGSARKSSGIHRSRSRRGGPPGPRATGLRSDVRLTLPARPENVAVIRHVLGAFALALRLPPELVEDMRLAVTEACTNVVRHAYGDDEDGMIEVVIRPVGDRLEMIVSDHGAGMGPTADPTGPGLGLPMIHALADTVELEHAPNRGSRIAMSFRYRPRLGLV